MRFDNKFKQVMKIPRLKTSLRINTAFSRNIPRFIAAVEKVISHSPLVGQSKNHTHARTLPSKVSNFYKQDLNNWSTSLTNLAPNVQPSLCSSDTYKVHGGAFKPSTHGAGDAGPLRSCSGDRDIKTNDQSCLLTLPCWREKTLYQRVCGICPV